MVDVEAESSQHEASHQLQWRLVGLHEVHYESHAERGQHGVADVLRLRQSLNNKTDRPDFHLHHHRRLRLFHKIEIPQKMSFVFDA